MSHQIPTGRLAMTLICLAVGLGPVAKAQDIFGALLGPVIEAGAGEVFNRAGGQILEGALNGGLRTPFSGQRRRGRPSGRQRVSTQRVQPAPVYSQPTPIYSQPAPVYSQPAPVYSQPAPVYSQPVPAHTMVETVPSRPVESFEQTLADPPANEIPVRQRLQANVSPLDLALTHVVDEGPALAARVMQIEAEAVLKVLDDAIVRQLRRDEQGKRMLVGFQATTQTQCLPTARQEWLAKHRNGELAGKSGLVVTVEASILVSSLAGDCPDLSFSARQREIDALRVKIPEIPLGMLGGQERALVAERVRNLRNITLLAELARLSGIERRLDLFERINTAAIKSDAPEEFVSLLTGFALPHDSIPVPQTSLSGTVPMVALHNPLNSRTPVRFNIEGEGEFMLPPGDTAAGTEAVVVAFDNGKGNTKRYTLRDGFFQWKIKDGSWDIRQKTTVKFLIDASQSKLPFHYLVDGEPMVVRPGEIAQHSSSMPPRIDFDRGIGDGSVATKILNPGRFNVSVDPETGAFELYPIADQTAQESSTTRERAVQGWRASVARVQNDINAEADGPLDRTLDSLLNEIE